MVEKIRKYSGDKELGFSLSKKLQIRKGEDCDEPFDAGLKLKVSVCTHDF